MTGPVLPSLVKPQLSSPIRDLSDAPRSLLGTLSGQKPRYYCERSRYTLLGPEQDGKRTLYHAPCKSNRCPHCGRANMYRKRNRINDRLKLDRETGLNDRTASEFVTITLRPDACSVAFAYKWIKKGLAYAVKCVRKSRKYNKRYRRAEWSGCEIEYVNDVDIQPGTRMPHVHGLHRIRFSGVKASRGVEQLRARYSRRLAKELHYYLNNFLRLRLNSETYGPPLPLLRWKEGLPYPYQGADSVAYVHFSSARSTENCVMYMALHNGKIWTDGRDYPRNYRRFATSRGFLAKEEKEPSGFEFIRHPLGLVVQKLADQRVTLDFAESERGHDGTLLSVSVPSGEAYHCWETETGIQRQVDTKNAYRLNFALGRAEADAPPRVIVPRPLPLDAQEKMLALQDYWDSNADLDGGRFEAGPVHPKTGLPSGSHFVPGLTFEEWRSGLANVSLSASAPPAPYDWRDDPWEEASSDPFADDLPASLVAAALELSRTSGQSFSESVAMIERLNVGVASWNKKTPHRRR